MQDDDPYVRKTAAVCVAKLFDINPELVEDRGFLDMLRVRATDAAASARRRSSQQQRMGSQARPGGMLGLAGGRS